MSRGPDAAAQLERALIAQAQAAACPVRIGDWAVTRWASATFTGARHVVSLTADAGPALDCWLAGLPEAEFALKGHLVADLAVAGTQRTDGTLTAEIEALTVEAR